MPEVVVHNVDLAALDPGRWKTVQHELERRPADQATARGLTDAHRDAMACALAAGDMDRWRQLAASWPLEPLDARILRRVRTRDRNERQTRQRTATRAGSK